MEYEIYCGGSFLRTGAPLSVVNPFDGRLAGTTFLAGADELETAILAAERAAPVMKDMPGFLRTRILSGIANGILASREELALLLCRESAKPLRYALAEIDRAIQTFTVASEECRRIPAEYMSLDWTPAGKGKSGLLRYFPAGIVAGISPFNFPMNLAVHKIAPAIAAGCPIVLKPASATPLSTLALARIIDQTELPKGAVSVLPMDRRTGDQLVTDPRFALLSFTGSPAVGWEMKPRAGKKKVVLELGGNAAVIIARSADLALALQKSLVAAFAYSGQICIHAQRFYVHESLFDEFCRRLCDAAARLVTGNPADPATEFSCMIDEASAIRTEQWIAEAVAAGAHVLLNGRRTGAFHGPVVLTGTDVHMKVNSEEVFAPVICIEKFSSFREAITLVNDSRFGLQAGVFTTEIGEMDLAFEEIEAGTVLINEAPGFRMDHMPYGGLKDSGQGREGVRHAMLDMLEPKLLVR